MLFRAILFNFNHDILSNKWDVMQLICVCLLQFSVSSDQQMNRWKWIPISQLYWWYMSLESLTWFWKEKKKTLERRIYRCRFMSIKRLIDLGRLQWLWSMFYYKKEMLIFLKISEFINISLEDIRGPSIMGLVQTQYIHAWHI